VDVEARLTPLDRFNRLQNPISHQLDLLDGFTEAISCAECDEWMCKRCSGTGWERPCPFPVDARPCPFPVDARLCPFPVDAPDHPCVQP
jgi:hypothetical protein